MSNKKYTVGGFPVIIHDFGDTTSTVKIELGTSVRERDFLEALIFEYIERKHNTPPDGACYINSPKKSGNIITFDGGDPGETRLGFIVDSQVLEEAIVALSGRSINKKLLDVMPVFNKVIESLSGNGVDISQRQWAKALLDTAGIEKSHAEGMRR